MISKTKLEKRINKKTNPKLVETLKLCKKNEKCLELGKILSSSKRKQQAINLSQINQQSKDNEKILFPGKVLSQGKINKKIKIIALNFSESTKKILEKGKITYNTISEEINENPELKEIKILKW